MYAMLTKVQKILFVFLILGAPLSKYPSIALPAYDFTSFRIGLYQFALLLFVLLTIPSIIFKAYWRLLDKTEELAIGFVGLLAFLALFGLNRVQNFNRSLLMVASFELLLLGLISAFYFVRHANGQKAVLVRYMLIAGVGYGLISLFQLLLATFVSKENALLCVGCGSDVFGFPRISGLAAEPLFWANALLPFFVVAYITYSRVKSRLALYALLATSFAIAVTFARGAYLAVVGIVAVDLIWRLAKKQTISFASLGLIIGGVVAGLTLLVSSAVIKYPDAPYIFHNTVAGMVDHLSLGIISPELKYEPIATTPASDAVLVETDENGFVTEGFVEASSNDRLGAADMALTVWRKPSNVLLGVGLGNLGPYVVANINPFAPDNLTVYIFYVLFLVEMGLVGLLLLLVIYGAAIRRLYRQRTTEARIVILVLIGFLVQYVFLGSYINVAYIWLWLGIGLGMRQVSGKEEGGSSKGK